MKKYLIIKTSALGDIIHTFPVVQYLRQREPECVIDWVVEKPFSDIVMAHPEISNVFTIESKKWRKNIVKQTWSEIWDFRKKLQQTEYDAVFDLQGNTKSGIVTFLAKSNNKVGFARQSVPEWPNLLFTNKRFNTPKSLNIREDYLSIVKQYFNDDINFNFTTKTLLKIAPEQTTVIESILNSAELNSKPLIMICPGSAWENKQLSLGVLIEFTKKIQSKYNGSFLWVWGNEKEYDEVHELYKIFKQNSLIVPKLALPVLQHLMDRMDYVVAVDSLPLHLAGTTSTTTFGVFGPSMGNKYAPSEDFYQGECPYKRTFEKRCPVLRTCPTGACMKDINPNDLFIRFSRTMD